MEQVSISVGRREVIASGVIHTRGNEEITLKLRELSFFISFRSTDDKKMNVVGELPDGNSLRLFMENFDNGLGISYWSNIGQLEGRQLSLDLFVHSTGEPNNNRLVSFSFTLEETGAAHG